MSRPPVGSLPRRILVVDDAVVVRRILVGVIDADPELSVAGEASNGKLALESIGRSEPDLVLLDVEMPELDGLATLREIRRRWPKLPVLMFSSLTQRNAATTIEALSLGANDYVPKPDLAGGLTASVAFLQAELLPKMKQLAQSAPCSPSGAGAMVARSKSRRDARHDAARVDVVVIGASTGGPAALNEFLPQLPSELDVPVLLVQHMPPMFTRLLAQRLESRSRVRVVEAQDGEAVVAGCVYVAPGDYHMGLAKSADGCVRVKLHQGSAENSCRPAVDATLRDVVRTYGAATLVVILTGMGQDGLAGCQEVVTAGGQVLVQDERTSVVWGMPGAVARAGLADNVLPLPELADAVLARLAAAAQVSGRDLLRTGA